MSRHKKGKHWARHRGLRTGILLLAISAGLLYVFNRASATLQSFTAETFNKFSAARISFGSIDYSMNGMIELTDLSVSPKEQSAYDNTIFSAKTIRAKLSIPRLLIGQVRIANIAVQDFSVNVQYDIDRGKWNAGMLAIARGAGTSKSLPNIRLVRGTLHYSKIVGGVLSDVLTIPLDAKFKCSGRDGDTVRFHVTTADRNGVKGSDLEGLWNTGPHGSLNLNGRLSSTNVPIFDNVWDIDDLLACVRYDANTIHIDQFQMRLGQDTRMFLAGSVSEYKTRPSFDVKMSVQNLFHGPEPRPNAFIYSQSLLDNVGGPLCKKFFNEYRPSGHVDIDIAASGSLAKLAKTQCRGYINCKDVSILYYKFPYRLDAITGRIDFTNKEIVLNDLAAHHNDNEFKIAGYSKDFGPNWDANVVISTPKVSIDQDVYNALTTEEKKAWFLLSPSGTTAMEYRFRSTPGIAVHEGTVKLGLTDVSVVYQNFPYPLKHLTGTVAADRHKIEFDNVISKYDSRIITLNGVVMHNPNEPKWDLRINAKHIPLDPQFRSALPDTQRHIYTNFAITGLIDTEIHIFNKEHEPNATFIADVVICDASLNYVKAPMPFEKIWANAQITPGRVEVKELHAQTAGAKVKFSGTIWPAKTGNENLLYSVNIDANELAVTDKVLKLLPAQTAELLSEFQPKGNVHISAHLDNTDSNCGPQRVVVDCLGNSVTYAKFPYPINDIRGRIIFEKEQIELQNICAQAGTSQPNQPTQTITISGRSDLNSSGTNGGNYDAEIRNLVLDDQFAKVLPILVRGTYAKFDPHGTINIKAHDLTINKKSGQVSTVSANATVDFKECRFMAAQYPVSKLDGTIAMALVYDADAGIFKANAVLDTETLEVKSRMLRNIHCDVEFDQAAQTLAARNISATLYGGRIAGNFELQQNNYLLETVFNNVDLNGFVTANISSAANPQFLGGKMNGIINIYGPSDSNDSRSGKVQLTVNKMQVAKLGLFGKLLLVLKLTEPTDYAFDKMVASAYLDRKTLIVEQLDMTGKSMSLCGSGNLNLNPGTIDLVFSAAGPRVFQKPSFFKSLADGFVPVVLRVKVTGDIRDPQIENTTLPVIKDTIEILGTRMPGQK